MGFLSLFRCDYCRTEWRAETHEEKYGRNARGIFDVRIYRVNEPEDVPAKRYLNAAQVCDTCCEWLDAQIQKRKQDCAKEV